MEFLGIETRRVEFLHGHSIGHELMSFCFFLVCIIANVLQSQDQGGVGYLSAFFSFFSSFTYSHSDLEEKGQQLPHIFGGWKEHWYGNKLVWNGKLWIGVLLRLFFSSSFYTKAFFFWRKSVMKETEWFLFQRMF